MWHVSKQILWVKIIKKKLLFKYEKRATSRLFNPLGWRVSSSCSQKYFLFLNSSTLLVWLISITSQSSSPWWFTPAKWALNYYCFFFLSKRLWAHIYNYWTFIKLIHCKVILESVREREREKVSLRSQSECGKMGVRITPNMDTSYAVILVPVCFLEHVLQVNKYSIFLEERFRFSILIK